MDLTMCGLLVERAEEMAKLYATHRDWNTVEDHWFEERIDERSTKGSSQKIYRVLSSRFKTADKSLPAVSRLPSVFDQCDTAQDKAQILYLYLIEDDPLVKYIVHQYVNRHQNQDVGKLEFNQETISALLNGFHYADGSEIEYATSTMDRWGRGLRSVMREIGVLQNTRTTDGQPPNLGTIPLLVTAGYSWEKSGEDWLTQPNGWLYLFQPEPYWESLAERLSNHSSWETGGIHGSLKLRPADVTFGWAEKRGDVDD